MSMAQCQTQLLVFLVVCKHMKSTLQFEAVVILFSFRFHLIECSSWSVLSLPTFPKLKRETFLHYTVSMRKSALVVGCYAALKSMTERWESGG